MSSSGTQTMTCATHIAHWLYSVIGSLTSLLVLFQTQQIPITAFIHSFSRFVWQLIWIAIKQWRRYSCLLWRKIDLCQQQMNVKTSETWNITKYVIFGCRSNHCVAVLGDVLCVMGGRDDDSILKTAERYDSKTVIHSSYESEAYGCKCYSAKR
jgi:hypothetical protein